jgi:hypothetical protein
MAAAGAVVGEPARPSDTVFVVKDHRAHLRKTGWLRIPMNELSTPCTLSVNGVVKALPFTRR